MIIIGRDHIGIDSLFLHQRTQRCDSVTDHDVLPFCAAVLYRIINAILSLLHASNYTRKSDSCKPQILMKVL